jgi:hypothetical protein
VIGVEAIKSSIEKLGAEERIAGITGRQGADGLN